MKSSTTFGVSLVNLCLVFSGAVATLDVMAQSTNVFISKIAANTTPPPTIHTAIATTTASMPIRIRKISTMIQENLIPGSSDYVPVKEKIPNIENATMVSVIAPKPPQNLTNSNANVFEAVPSAKRPTKDPLHVNAQQQNPFMSGVGGVNPQIAMLLRNNPRLQMLARQNPVIAQQIMRNPQLLRNPMIQRAIQSQLSDGQGQNLLGQIGQLGLTGLNGLGRALNPLGLPIGGNPLMRGNNNNNHNNNMANGRNRLNANNNHNNEGNLQNFGLPNNRQQNLGRRTNPHQDTLNGGYYGDNQNYNPPAENNEVDDGQNDEENAIDPGQQDYGDNTGEENGGVGDNGEGGGNGDGGGGGGEDSQQNPADDPDIQQLQNFGGPMNDNFPEGLFPPGLLSKEDIQEIRRQQEKQQREDEERERLQQQQQYNNNDQPETSSPDYEDVNGGGGGGEGENAEENAGTEQPEEGVEGEAEEEGHNQPVDNDNEHVEPGGGMVMDHNPNHNHNHHNNDNVNIYTTPVPPAYRNAYQPLQPGQGNGPDAQMLNHGHGGNEYQHVPQHQGPMSKNQFNLKSNVEYEPPNHYDHTDGGLNQHHNQNGYTSTFAPPNIGNRGHYESPLRPHSHHRGHYSPNVLRNRHHTDDRQSIHHPYPRPKLSQYTLGHQISNIESHKDRDDFPRSALYQDNDIDDGHHQPPKATFSNIRNHHHRQQRHPDFDRTTSKYPRPRMRLF